MRLVDVAAVALGAQDKKIYVVPSLDLVVSRHGGAALVGIVGRRAEVEEFEPVGVVMRVEQIGKLLGLEMYGTSSSDEKLARVKELGLQHPINYKRHEYEEVVKNLTHGEGVDAVFEMLGGEHTAKSLRCLRDFGRVIQYGTATGKSPQIDLRAMYAKSASVQGLWLTYLSQKREIMEPAWRQLSEWISQKKLTPQIGHVLPLERGVEAFKLLEEGKNYGKIVVKIAG